MKLTNVNQIEPSLLTEIEDRINAKVSKLPDKLIPRLFDELGDPPAAANISQQFVTLISMTIQDLVRQAVDKRFKNHIQGLVDKYPRELQAQLQERPYIGGPPASWWSEKQRELEQALSIFLVTAYGLSAKWHGMDQAVAEVQSAKFAQSRAKQVAGEYIQRSKDLVERLQTKWAAAATVVGGLSMAASNRSATTGSKATPPASASQNAAREPSFSDVRRELKNIFSPARTETMAVSEVTGAVSTAGEELAKQNGSESEEDTWWTVDDDRVCEICEPLHGRPRSEWASKFPLGPPAHPNCRCRVSYAG